MKTIKDRLKDEFRFLLWYPRKREKEIQKAIKKTKQSKTEWINDSIIMRLKNER